MNGYYFDDLDYDYEYEDFLPVYKCPEDCFYEIVNNLFNSVKVNDHNLLDDTRWMCKYYDVCPEIHNEIDFARNNYIDRSFPLEGKCHREIFCDVKSAVKEMAKRLYFGSKVYTDKDMRPLVAFLLDQYKMDTDLVDEFKEKIA